MTGFMPRNRHKTGNQMHEIRVYYQDTDAEGVVYYANYLRYMEIARTEFMRDQKISVEDFAKQGKIFIVASAQVNYHAPAYFGDILQIHTKIPQLKRASFIFEHKIINKADKRLIVTSQTKMACVSSDHKPIPLPAELSTSLKQS